MTKTDEIKTLLTHESVSAFISPRVIEVMLMTYFGGLTENQIAKYLGIAKSTVAMHKRTGRWKVSRMGKRLEMRKIAKKYTDNPIKVSPKKIIHCPKCKHEFELKLKEN